MACVLADASSDCFLMRRSSDDRGEILIANLIDLFKKKTEFCVSDCNSWMLSVWSHVSWEISHVSPM